MGACKRCGHEERYKNGDCKRCAIARVQKNYLKNIEKKKSYDAERYKANAEKVKQVSAKWQVENREKVRQRNARWYVRNSHKYREYGHKRRARKVRAVPNWFGEFDQFVVQEAADLCKRRKSVMNFQWHVDHIVPLLGKTVCGLHVAQNIQVIPATLNMSKNNRYWPEMA